MAQRAVGVVVAGQREVAVARAAHRHDLAVRLKRDVVGPEVRAVVWVAEDR